MERPVLRVRVACSLVAAALATPLAFGQASRGISPERTQQLVHMVRQDCGSCHGMQLTGGLGPALTREALANKPVPYLAAVITHGLQGTPMPPWKALLDERDAYWIAEQLALGFPTQNPKK
ncbi:cytochrome c [Diaphorobacter aerolatus]|uniref:Cytochrome c n=2 Tax=Diaphorobacter aerolatus TaxID=1288495 RepID=A0A7H0GPY2_9BURK|nr:cytochrome c [Diaphorobacter aerolatus]